MIPPFIEYGRRNGKQRDRDIIGSLLYSNEFMQRRGVVIVTDENAKIYKGIREHYVPYVEYPKTDGEIMIMQKHEIDSLRRVIDTLNENCDKTKAENDALKAENDAVIEQNKKLKEEIAKLKKESKTLTFESDGGLFNIEYQGMKFKATKVIIREGMLCNRVMEITANSVSE